MEILKLLKPRRLLNIIHAMMILQNQIESGSYEKGEEWVQVLFDLLEMAVDAVERKDQDCTLLLDSFVWVCKKRESYMKDNGCAPVCWKLRSVRYGIIRSLVKQNDTFQREGM